MRLTILAVGLAVLLPAGSAVAVEDQGVSIAEVGLSGADCEGPVNLTVAATPNDRFCAHYLLQNDRSSPVEIILGLSIVDGKGDWASDPTHDHSCTVPANNTTWCSRLFDVPGDVSDGRADVVFKIYTATADAALDSARSPELLVIYSAPDYQPLATGPWRIVFFGIPFASLVVYLGYLGRHHLWRLWDHSGDRYSEKEREAMNDHLRKTVGRILTGTILIVFGYLLRSGL